MSTTAGSQPAASPGAVDRDLLAPRFPVLDSLRAVGALAVLTTHVAFYSGAYVRHGVAGTLLARLDVGVAIFFVLSGFLLSRPYLVRAALHLPRPATGHYLWKRALRIYPVYAVAVVLALAALRDNRGLGFRDWVVTLSFTNTFVDRTLPAGLTQMWSLGVEVTFYLALPLLTLLGVGRRGLHPWRVVGLLAAMAAASVWWHLDGGVRLEDTTASAAQQWLPAYLGWFAVGMALALLHVLHATGRTTRLASVVLGLGRQPGACWALAGALLLVAATPLAGPVVFAAASASESLVKHVLYALVGGFLVLSGVVADRHMLFGRVGSATAARHLGWISYSVFCLHQTMLDLIASALGWPVFRGHGWELWVLTVVASLAVAELTYRAVELPALRLKRFFPLRSAAQATAAASGTSAR